MGNLRDEDKLRTMKPTDVVLGADEQGCLVNFPPENFSGSIPVNIDTETGDGQELFTEPQVNDYLFKKIKSKDGSTDVITDTDGNIDLSVNFPPFPPFPEIPTVDYPVIDSVDLGDGTSLRNPLDNKKIPISTLKSDDLIITKQPDGSVKINTAGGGSNSSDWFIDPLFNRPANWNTSQNPKEQITYLSSMSMINPSVYTNGQVVPLPSGTLNDPFKTFEEYLLKRIYGAGTGVVAPYSKVNPAYPGVRLQILSNVVTASDIEVVNTTYYLRNGSYLTYSGSRDYAIDHAELFNSMPLEGGKIKSSSFLVIKGEGSIERTNGFGLIRHKTDKTKTNSEKQFRLELTGEGNGLYIIESKNNSLYHTVTKEDGVTELANGNGVCKGTTQAPTTPLIVIDGVNSGYWSAEAFGSKIFINIKSQIGIHCINEGCISSSADNFMFQVDNERFGYQKRLYGDGVSNTMAGITSEEQEIVNHFYNPNNGNGHVFYLPHPDFCVFKSENSTLPNRATFRIEKISTEANGFSNAGADSIFQLTNSHIVNETSYKDMGGGTALNFLKLAGDNYIYITNAGITPFYFNMVKGVTGSEDVSINFVNSSINAKYIKKTLATLTVYTAGTISSIKNTPVMGQLLEYSDNTEASAVLVAGSLYRNLTTKAVTQVY